MNFRNNTSDFRFLSVNVIVHFLGKNIILETINHHMFFYAFNEHCKALQINIKDTLFFCPALTKLALDLHVNFGVSVYLFVCLFVFPVFFSTPLIG